MSNAGQTIFNISQAAFIAAYETFTDGYQPTAYQTINANLSQALNNSSYKDLRAAYLDPITFPPETLLTDVSVMQMPSGLDSSDQADWTTVQTQLKTEITEISSLYNFWTLSQTNANSLSVEFTNRFSTASSTLDDSKANGTLEWLSLLSSILDLFPETAGAGVIMGLIFGAANLGQSSSSASGDMGALQTQLSNLIETTIASATDIYQPIAQDWGKLQQFYTAVASASTTLLQSDVTSAGVQYELSIYQAVIPSFMAIVYFPDAPWGNCGIDGYALANTPTRMGQSGYNGHLCSRLTTLGINLQDVINKTGPWSSIPSWRCSSSRLGSSCEPG